MLDLFQEQSLRKVMRRVQFSLMNRPFGTVNICMASLAYIKSVGTRIPDFRFLFCGIFTYFIRDLVHRSSSSFMHLRPNRKKVIITTMNSGLIC